MFMYVIDQDRQQRARRRDFPIAWHVTLHVSQALFPSNFHYENIIQSGVEMSLDRALEALVYQIYW
jgi:hypothetical protein